MIGKIENVIKRNAGKNVYYFGTLSTDKAKLSTFVPTLETSESYLDQETKDGYQRPGTKARMNKFKKYVTENPNCLIPPVILSGRGNWAYSGTGEVGILTLNGRAAVIDGQHRLGGLVSMFEDDNENQNVDFICFDSITLEEEIFEFMKINGEQKGVPKAQITYLKGETEAELAWELNTNSKSPFKGKIFRTSGDQFTYYALHSIAKNIERTFANGAFTTTTGESTLDFDEQLDVLIQFWTSIAKHNKEAWADLSLPKRQQKMKLAELTGNIAWSIVAPQILVKGFAPQSGTFNWKLIDEIIKFMSDDFNWDKEGEFSGLTGEVGGRRIAKSLESILAHFS